MQIKVFIFLLGAILGSFSKALVDRTISGESIIYPPSHCDRCQRKIKAYDLIPIYSYIRLKGRCRSCQSKIPIDTLMVEIIGAILFLLIFDPHNPLSTSILYLGLMINLIISLIDLKTLEIDMGQVAVLGFLGICYRYLTLGFDMEYIIIIITLAMVYALLYYLSKGGLGDGDIYLYLVTSLFLSNSLIIWMVLISIWLAAIYAIFVAIKEKSLKVAIPFCIYIFMSFLILVLFIGA